MCGENWEVTIWQSWQLYRLCLIGTSTIYENVLLLAKPITYQALNSSRLKLHNEHSAIYNPPTRLHVGGWLAEWQIVTYVNVDDKGIYLPITSRRLAFHPGANSICFFFSHIRFLSLSLSSAFDRMQRKRLPQETPGLYWWSWWLYQTICFFRLWVLMRNARVSHAIRSDTQRETSKERKMLQTHHRRQKVFRGWHTLLQVSWTSEPSLRFGRGEQTLSFGTRKCRLDL